jgi:hypothetical protein
MKKIIFALTVCCAVFASMFGVKANFHHGAASAPVLSVNSQLTTNFLGDGPVSGEYKFLNRMKETVAWIYGDQSSWANGADLDADGYPLFGSVASTKGVFTSVYNPSQATRPGNYVVTATGAGDLAALNLNGASSTVTCSSVTTSGVICSNQTCSTISGSISGTTLTVTVASSCSLVVGLPISTGSTVVDPFGVPTIITGMSGSANCGGCTGAGGTGTYLVNFTQTNSGPYNLGIRAVIAPGTETTAITSLWRVSIGGQVSGNILGHVGLVHADDESKYWAGQLTGDDFKKRVQQGGFGVLRDLDTAHTNLSNVATWADRKKSTYFSYYSPEMRPSIYTSVSYALNAGSNDYSSTFGSGAPVDKEQVCVTPGTSATNLTVTFNKNTTGTKPILDYRGVPLFDLQFAPKAGHPLGLTYSADFGGWLSSRMMGDPGCLFGGAPPEAFARMVSEIGGSMNTVWAVMPLNASIPISDYATQYAKYVLATYPTMGFEAEVPDETWNCFGEGVGGYVDAQAKVFMARDTFWNTNGSSHTTCSGGDINNWTGYAASLLGQAVHAVSPSYKVIVGVQTIQSLGGISSAWNDNIRSSSYLGQNLADMPIQSGCAGPGAIQTSCPAPFIQRAAYKDIDYVTPANYWEVDPFTRVPEVALAYCYFYNPGGSCPSQATSMANYLVSASGLTLYWPNWHTFAATCAGGSGCTPLGLVNYEGGYTTAAQTSDVQDGASASASIAGPATRLTVANSGNAVVGQTVQVIGATGGTWPTINNNTYTVTAIPDSTHITINLDSSGLGTLTGFTFSYFNSAKYVTYLRTMSLLEPALYTLETTIYNQISSTGATSACGVGTKCSLSPSQFNLANWLGNANGGSLAFYFDIYGYFTQGSCTACTISGANLTLGGTIIGIFKSGLKVFGGGVTGGTTISSACSKTGSEPAGSNVGDVCPLSASSTVSVGENITANLAPSSSTQNPITAWKAICDYNSSPLASGC